VVRTAKTKIWHPFLSWLVFTIKPRAGLVGQMSV